MSDPSPSSAVEPSSDPLTPSEDFVDRFFSLCNALCVVCLVVLAVFPGVAALDVLRILGGEHSTESGNYLDAGAHVPIGLLLLRLAGFLAIALALLRPLALGRRVRPVMRWSGFLLASLFFSSVLSTARGEALPEWLNFVLFLGVFALALDFVQDRRRQMFGMVCLATSATLVAYVGLGLYWLSPQGVLTTPFFQPNVLAGYLAMILPVTLVLMLEGRTPFSRILTLWAAVGQGTALLLTCSRGGWFSALLAMLLFAVAMVRIRGARHVLGSLAVWFAISWLFFSIIGSLGSDHHFRLMPSVAFERAKEATNEDSPSLLARLAFYDAAFKIWLAHPLFGTGLNSFNRYYTQVATDFRWYARYTHSLYLDLLSEGGLFSFLSFLGLMACIGKGARVWQKDDRQPFRIALVLGMLASLVHSVVDFDWKFATLPVTFFLMAALALAPDEPEEIEAPSGTRWGSLGRLAMSLVFVGLIGLSGCLYHSEHFYQVGRSVLDRNQADQALPLLKEAVDLFPLNSEYSQATIDADMRLYTEHADPSFLRDALGYARLGVRVDDHRAVNWDRLGKVNWDSGHRTEAAEAYREALKLDPINFPQFYNHLAEAEVALGHDEEANRLWDEVDRRFPLEQIRQIQSFRQPQLLQQLVEAYANRGDYFLGIGDAPRALEYLSKAIKIAPRDGRTQLSLGSVCYFTRDYQAAVPYLSDLALHGGSKNPLVHILLGACYEALGRKAEAEAEFKTSWALDPHYKGMRAPRLALRKPGTPAP